LPQFDQFALFISAFLGQALNTVAGGGSFVTFPALLFAGVAPIEANATSTIALWPGALSSAWGYRSDFAASRRVLATLAAVSVIGGLLGALALLHTPEQRFKALIPFLLGFATALFAASEFLAAKLKAVRDRGTKHGLTLAVVAGVQFLVAVYGGYFGGGIGIMMLAAFAFMDVGDIHGMNGLKALLGAVINGAAVVTFIIARLVDWRLAVPMIVASILSGYFGARMARRIDPVIVRRLVIVVGAVMTAAFALQR
jgi:uncharacterized membrane protein YfcA